MKQIPGGHPASVGGHTTQASEYLGLLSYLPETNIWGKAKTPGSTEDDQGRNWGLWDYYEEVEDSVQSQHSYTVCVVSCNSRGAHYFGSLIMPVRSMQVGQLKETWGTLWLCWREVESEREPRRPGLCCGYVGQFSALHRNLYVVSGALSFPLIDVFIHSTPFSWMPPRTTCFSSLWYYRD